MPPKPHNDIEKITDKAVRDICSVAVAPAAKSKVRAIILSVIAEVLEEKAKKIEELTSKMYCSEEHLGYHNKECDGVCQKYGLLLAQQIIRGNKL